MRAEILSIGTEILVGSITNTNSQTIAQALAKEGIDVYHQVTVGDNIQRIVECLENASQRSDIIVVSGGLGPTEDDVTYSAVAQFLKTPLHFHKPTYLYILGRLKKRRLAMTRLIAKQCHVPSDSAVIKNDQGTAPGVLHQWQVNGRGKYILVLPGPPRELIPMLDKALPLLIKMAAIKKTHFLLRSIKIAGLIEAQVAQKTTDLLKLKPPTTVGIYARQGEVELKIMCKASSQKKAGLAAGAIERKIRQRFGSKVFGVDDESLASALGKTLQKTKKTVSVAESCTGGLVGHLLTEVPGSSDYFLGGVVAYSNQIKVRELKVPLTLIQKYGAVSQEVAKKMATNARELFKTDYAIGITGIAGPDGGSKEKPVGLVYIALTVGKKVTAKKYIFFGSRAEIKLSAAQTALNELRLLLLK